MGRKKIPFLEFEKRFNDRSNGEYLYKSGYTHMSGKIKIQHLACGGIFETSPSAFVTVGTECPFCSKKIKNTEIYKKEIIDITDSEYSLESEYISSSDYIVLRHHKCNRTFKTKPDYFYRGNRCPFCCRKNTKYSLEEVNKKLKEIYGEKFIALNITYDSSYKTLEIECCKCGDKRNITFLSAMKGKMKCYNCKKSECETHTATKKESAKERTARLKKEKEMAKYNKYKNETINIHGDTITILTKASTTYDKLKVQCNKCKSIFDTNFKYLKQGKGCPICKISRGERMILEFLQKNNIIFEREFRFKGSEISRLRFDFAIFINGETILIEYDGKQHFSEKEQFGEKDKKSKFKKILERDKRKNKYCEDNNIMLIRIPYTKISIIEEILNNELKNKLQ